MIENLKMKKSDWNRRNLHELATLRWCRSWISKVNWCHRERWHYFSYSTHIASLRPTHSNWWRHKLGHGQNINTECHLKSTCLILLFDGKNLKSDLIRISGGRLFGPPCTRRCAEIYIVINQRPHRIIRPFCVVALIMQRRRMKTAIEIAG